MEAAMNIEALLKPIRPDAPSGADLRYSEIYDDIKEARRADDQLVQGEWQTDFKSSDWRLTVKLCSSALNEKSKDLQIAVWLLEAWVFLHGYAGLSAGLDLIRRLLEDYWQTLYPQIEDGDLDYRIGPLAFLNEKLPSAVFHVPLSDPSNSKGYTYYQLEESRLVGFSQNLNKEQKLQRETLIREGKISGEEFSAAVISSPIAYYQKIFSELEQCQEALLALDRFATKMFAPNPPGFTQLMEAIEACGHVVGRIFKDKQKSEIVPQEEIEITSTEKLSVPLTETNDRELQPAHEALSAMHAGAIGDISKAEKTIWQMVSEKMGTGRLKEAMDHLLSAAALSPSIREKSRYFLLLAKLCLKADRADLAKPIVEDLYCMIETLQLDKWEHPSWVAEVVETLYRCLAANDELQSDRAKALFQKLCLLNVTKAAAYRVA